MENASMPWSLVGISADARKAVRMAATQVAPVAAPPVIPAPPAPPAPAAPAAQPVSSEQINAIQILLAQLGFDPGAPDGAVGEQTRSAIRNYQRELGLPVDGEASTSLLTHLRQIAGAR
jgi:peptidoglycan hydrolase-like protein with peptidoglycan-binding domain